jgi:hypothetical protein
MVCEIERHLAEEFALAARQLADITANLGRLSTGTLDPVQLLREEEEILRQAGETLRQAEAARAALEAHIGQHRCMASRLAVPQVQFLRPK